MSKRSFPRFVIVLLLVFAIGEASEASFAYASRPPEHAATAAAQKKPKPKPKPKVTSLATAAAWVDIAAQHKLQADKPAPEQFTDPSAPRVQQISALISGLGFKGLAILTFNRLQPDPADPSLLVGNYIVKDVVFGSASDAQKFRAADAKEVTDRGSLKNVGTYSDGVVLDDAQGHINVMFTIGNVAVDIRIGVTENAPGDGVKDVKKIGDYVVANSKKT